jgi:hypothetical protein
MNNAQVNAKYRDGKNTIEVNLTTVIWEEDNVHFIYAPALDLTGYGQSLVEARKSFGIVLSGFLRYTHNKGTIFKELEKHGWLINKKKKRVSAPAYEEMLEDNEHFSELVNSNPNLRREDSRVNLALA